MTLGLSLLPSREGRGFFLFNSCYSGVLGKLGDGVPDPFWAWLFCANLWFISKLVDQVITGRRPNSRNIGAPVRVFRLGLPGGLIQQSQRTEHAVTPARGKHDNPSPWAIGGILQPLGKVILERLHLARSIYDRLIKLPPGCFENLGNDVPPLVTNKKQQRGFRFAVSVPLRVVFKDERCQGLSVASMLAKDL